MSDTTELVLDKTPLLSEASRVVSNTVRFLSLLAPLLSVSAALLSNTKTRSSRPRDTLCDPANALWTLLARYTDATRPFPDPSQLAGTKRERWPIVERGPAEALR